MEGGRWSKKAKNLSTYFVNDPITKILNFNLERVKILVKMTTFENKSLVLLEIEIVVTHS